MPLAARFRGTKASMANKRTNSTAKRMNSTKKAMPKRTYSSANPLKALEPPPEPVVVEAPAVAATAPLKTKKDELSCQSEHITTRAKKKNQRFQKTQQRRSQLVKTRSLKFSARDFVTTKVGQDLRDVYDVHNMVGEGGYGEVYRCTHRQTGSQRAVKVLPRSRAKFSQENLEVRNEFEAVKMLDHPNILRQYHMYESEDKFHIVSDLYQGGELLDYIMDNGRMEEQDCKALMNHLLSCVNYIHQEGWCHRDLKPENILLCANKRWEDIKVIDFGLAKKHNPKTRMTEVYGTPYYMSPQTLKGSYTNKCDIWSIGSICFTALSGYACFDGEDMDDVVQWVLDGDWDFDDDVWEEVSEEAKDFITQLLTYDEEKRPSALEALQHPWLVAERRASKKAVFVDEKLRTSMHNALQGILKFDVGQSCKLKQATYALLSSQLLPKEERATIDEMFRVLDVDCNGRLSRAEIQKGFRDFYDQHKTDDEINDLFQKVNFSGSGEIEYSEFVCACLMASDVFLDEKRLRAAFDAFDVDGSGIISVDNLRQVFFGECNMASGSNQTVDDEMLDKIIGQVDTNGDGEIDFEQFQIMMSITTTASTSTTSSKEQQPSKEDTIRAWSDSKLMFSNFKLNFDPAVDLENDDYSDYDDEDEDDDDALLSSSFHTETVQDTDGILQFEDDTLPFSSEDKDKTMSTTAPIVSKDLRRESEKSQDTAVTTASSCFAGDESVSSITVLQEDIIPKTKQYDSLMAGSSASSHQSSRRRRNSLEAMKDELKTVSVHERRRMFESSPRTTTTTRTNNSSSRAA